ncbi:AraC family transcriptional regulator [Phytopseudomonas dryadis]|uniref:AraC family transcriptional regulator n=1 Tax=Phytopseudomonas dryadis TaxID=2487520 RepID=A0A4Q9RAF4_9GAMM|nr:MULTISPECIES: AraC family transcriptional regulator [Pseudomonas]TBU97547.1 AraC family transcriptional regulator [Pseudomonas dryadis]TBV10002.1 AraC family transcriptional regulator [Pseudomonas dryadis]TBV19169.1 AraC family transcriptional regulator [Pseudomonas sp. FRB 230]
MNSSTAPFEWLLENLELDASLFHVGRYCGNWQASTHGLARASFHLLVQGECWLHFDDGSQPLALLGGDAVFLLRDMAYRLSNEAHAEAARCSPRGSMQPLTETRDGVALVCGFFHFRPGLSSLVLQALPSFLVLRAGDPSLSAARRLFELILAECERDDGPSGAFLERLSHLLFLYVLREQGQAEHLGGLLGIARHPQFSTLLEQLIARPEHNWSMQEMAVHSGLSRSAFCKRFQELSGTSPGQMLISLRVRLACSLLKQGLAVADVAEAVGYQSVAAFTRAFAKVSGVLPGAYRKQFL